MDSSLLPLLLLLLAAVGLVSTVFLIRRRGRRGR